MLTTADLPHDMQLPPPADTTAVAASGLTITCRHGDPHCVPCIHAAARTLIGTR